MHRIGRAGVLGLGAVVVVRHAGIGIEGHVFQHGAEAVGGVPDLRLGFLAELDGLGVAAAFEIEDAVRTPAVSRRRRSGCGSDRPTAWSCRCRTGRRTARSRPRATRWPSSASASTFLRRQIEVERGEHRLLHFAGVGRTGDQHDLAGEVDRHLRVGAFAAAVTRGVRLERRQIDDGHLRHELGEIGDVPDGSEAGG